MPRLPVRFASRTFLFAFLLGIFLLPAVAGAVTTGTQSPEERKASRFYEDALKRFGDGKFQGAAIQLRNALQLDPRHLPARILLGKALLKLRYGEAAESQLKTARGAGADDSLTLVPLGEAYLQQGKFEALLRELPAGQRPPRIEAGVRVLRGLALLELRVLHEAELEFLKARRLQPDDVKALLGLSTLRLSRGELAEAEELIDRAVALSPEDETVWHHKAKVRQARGDTKAALEYYNKSLSIIGTLLNVRADRASALIALGRDDEALKDIEYVRRISPRNPQAALLNALYLARRNDPKGAKEILDDVMSWVDVLATDFVMKHPPTLLLMGTIHFAMKRFDEALPFLHRHVELAPHVISARRMLGTIYLRKDDPKYALSLLEPALKRTPRDSKLILLLGTAHMRIGNYRQATRYFEWLSQLIPDSAVARTSLAKSKLALGRTSEALEDLEQATRIDPTTGRSGALLGILQLQGGNTAAALEMVEKLREADPKNPFPLNLAGSIYLRANQPEKAWQSFNEALEIDPEYRPARYNLAVLALRRNGAEAARKRYLAIVEGHAEETRAMSALADLALQRGDTKSAIKWLDQASKVDTKAVRPQLRLANLLLREGRLTEALQIIDSLENRAPRNLAVLDAKGRAQRAKGELAAAIQTYRHSSNIAAKTGPELLKVARTQLALQDLEGAGWTLQMAVNLDPALLPAQVALARLTFDQSGFEAAMERVLLLEKKFPGSPDVDTVKGDVLLRADHTDDAIAAYRSAQGKRPSGTLALRLFQAQRKAGASDKALLGIEQWVEKHPRDVRVRKVLALAYVASGNIDRAVTHHEALVSALPNDVMMINNLAMLYQRRGDARARVLAKRAFDLAPDEANTIDTYGWILVNSGEAERGLTLLRNAQARAATEPAIGFHIAVALDALGKHDEARRELEAAFNLGDKFEGAAEARKLLDRLKRMP